LRDGSIAIEIVGCGIQEAGETAEGERTTGVPASTSSSADATASGGPTATE
jgi:hypothetical protein